LGQHNDPNIDIGALSFPLNYKTAVTLEAVVRLKGKWS
jgi:hypothetical protein